MEELRLQVGGVLHLSLGDAKLLPQQSLREALLRRSPALRGDEGRDEGRWEEELRRSRACWFPSICLRICLISPVGFKGNLSLLEIFCFSLNQMEVSDGTLFPQTTHKNGNSSHWFGGNNPFLDGILRVQVHLFVFEYEQRTNMFVFS